MNNKRWIIYGVLAVALAFLFWLVTAEDRQPPDRKAIRAYRISILSDDEIRKMQKDAQAEFSRRELNYQEEQSKRLIELAKLADQCGDIAFRTRNEGKCSQGVPVGVTQNDRLPGDSEIEIFESLLVNGCLYAQTISQAKKMNCLPK